jgi:hypothetical protein
MARRTGSRMLPFVARRCQKLSGPELFPGRTSSHGQVVHVGYIDSLILNVVESVCHRVQTLTGRTNVWLAVQITNISVILYFMWAGLYFWTADLLLRVVVGLFCAGVFYALTQTVFRESIEESENNAYRRVAKGLRNPRRIRDVLLRISFLNLSILLSYPIFVAYTRLRIHIVLLTYFLIVLTTVLLYLLACDPLPPCPGRLREWLRGTARLRPARVPAVVPQRPGG